MFQCRIPQCGTVVQATENATPKTKDWFSKNAEIPSGLRKGEASQWGHHD